MKYYVTGATGFIGKHAARQLIEAGHQVIAPVRSPQKASDLQAMGVTVVKGDITDKESMRSSMAGVDGVFHIAGWYKIGARDTSEGERINVAGTRNVLELMRELNIPKGVYTSTLATFSDTHGKVMSERDYYDPASGKWVSVYDRTKWQAHHEVAVPLIKEGLPLVIVLPGLVYGPGDVSAAHDTFQLYLQRRLPVIPSAARFCWGHVEDTARGHLLAMEKGRPGEEYIIAGPIYSVTEVLASAQQLTGIPAPRMHLSRGMMNAMAGLMGVVGSFVNLPATYTAEGLRASTATYIGSNEKATRELGLQMRPIEQGLRDTLAYEMKQLAMAVPWTE